MTFVLDIFVRVSYAGGVGRILEVLEAYKPIELEIAQRSSRTS